MLRKQCRALGLCVRRQPMLMTAVVSLVVVLILLLQLLLDKGQERAFADQEQSNLVLIRALDDSITRSLQAVDSSLTSLLPLLTQQTTPIDTAHMLRALPQLRSINVVPLAQAKDCLPSNGQVRNSDLIMLPQHAGRYWGDKSARSGLMYWPICKPYFSADDELLGFIVASTNPFYFANLLDSIGKSGLVASLYHYSGSNLLQMDGRSLPSWIKFAMQNKAWGSLRISLGEQRYLESYRASPILPFVVVLRSYDRLALAQWDNDARLLKLAFAILIGGIAGLTGMFFYFSHKKEQMQGSNRLLSEAIRSTANAIFITSPQGKIRWVNNAFSRLTGYSMKEVRGRTPNLLNSGYHERPYFQTLWEAISSGQSWHGELVNRDKQGRLLHVNQVITPIFDSKGNIEHYIAVHEDISARKHAEERALYMAQHDALTGLTNRRHFEEQLSRSIATHRHGYLGLIFIDLDHFKEINDTLGHEAGDQLLKQSADKLMQVLPDDALLARLGGDEFAVLIDPLLSSQSLLRVAASITSALAKPFIYQGSQFLVTCSVGVTVGEIGESNASNLLRQADMAMYRSKQSGRNCFTLFDPSMDEAMQHRVSIQQELNAAIQKGSGFELFYQPQVDAKTGRMVGAEALIRWRLDNGEFVSPGDFIPIAEESGLIVELGKWVMDTACRQASQWIEQGLDVGKVAINVSSVQLSSSSLAYDLKHSIERYNLPPNAISVELTETALMVNSAPVSRNLTRFLEDKVVIAIDDFGVGYCSLSYLKRLDAHYLKVDQSFVAGIGVSSTDEQIITATIAMAKGLGMRVIAEGVETREQIDFLQQLNCDIFQGYYFAKPMAAEAFQDYVVNQPHYLAAG